MFCPQCKAEYRQGFTRCADCDVELVAELPRGSQSQDEKTGDRSHGVMPGDPKEDPFCAFWHGDDARLHSELCTVLEEASIPYRTAYRTDRLFNIKSYDAFRTSVPFSLFEKAELAVKEAFGTDEETGAVAVLTLPAPLSLAEFSDFSHDGEESDMWSPDDATVEIWSGDPRGSTEKLGDSLHGNGIDLRWMELDGKAHLFVRPGDEKRAREIVWKVVEGAPPD